MRMLIGSIASGDDGGGEGGTAGIGGHRFLVGCGDEVAVSNGSHPAASGYPKSPRRVPHDVCGPEFLFLRLGAVRRALGCRRSAMDASARFDSRARASTCRQRCGSTMGRRLNVCRSAFHRSGDANSRAADPPLPTALSAMLASDESAMRSLETTQKTVTFLSARRQSSRIALSKSGGNALCTRA